MKIDAARIKSWVERIERLLEERAGINGDIKDIYAEIKSGDHDAKAIRKLIQRRAQDEGELAEQDALLAAYTDAVAGKIKALEAIERGASTKEAAKVAGISTGAVSALAQKRSVQKSRKLNEPAHDPDAGEITEPVVSQAPPCAELASASRPTGESRCKPDIEGGAAETTDTPVLAVPADSGTGTRDEDHSPAPAAVDLSGDWDSVVEFGRDFQAAITARRTA